MLVQVHALYTEGHAADGRKVDDEYGGWRCVDRAGTQDVFHFQNLPADFIKKNKVDASDSANAYLSISSATKRKGRRRKENGDDDENTIKIHEEAKVTIKRGVQESGRHLEEGGRRLVQAGDPTGARTLLVVRVTDKNRDSPSQSASQIASDIFSDGNNLVRTPIS